MLFTHPPPAGTPRAGGAGAGGLGRADGCLLNIHSKVYVHMYTYVQTPPPAPGAGQRRGQGQTTPWKPLGSPKFSFAEERGWSMVAGFPTCSKDQNVPICSEACPA